MIATTKVNKCFQEVFTTKARYILLWGGRGRGGSHFATDYFLHKLTQPYYFRGYFMREIAGDIRQSLFQDFKDRIEDSEFEEERDFDLSDHEMKVTYPYTGNQIASKGFKKSHSGQTAKMKSIAGATHVIIEEAEEISEADFRQLDDSLRTTKAHIQVILIFNPPHKNHWIIKRWFTLVDHEDQKNFKGYYSAVPKQDENLLAIHTTFEDNRKNLNPSTLYNYTTTYKDLYFKTGDEYYPINVLGLVSEGKKGRVFAGCNWVPVKDTPNQYSKTYLLDFGFGGDPLALIEKEAHNTNRWYKEMIYESGLTNPQLSDRMDSLGISRSSQIIADSAELKSIQELRNLGWNVTGAKKGPGSVNAGINKLRGLYIHVTEDSKNIWQEYEDYVWMLDRDKIPTNKPKDASNHAIDAMRYGEENQGGFRLI